MPTFKFDSETAFLTYPQADIDFEELVNGLKRIKDIVWARVCRERHADGNPHIHIVCKFAGRLQSKNPRVFDVGGHHPNIQRVRSVKHALDYVSKDGEFRDFGTIPESDDKGATLRELAEASTYDEYFEHCVRKRISFPYAKLFWDKYGKATACRDTITSEYEADITRERFDVCLQTVAEGESVCIIGPTGCGKSSWAKRVAPKPALWVRHLDVLRQFKEGYHKAVIFDDMSFLHMPRNTQIYVADSSDILHLHCRYGHAWIPAGITKIFTANEQPFINDPAVNRRVRYIRLI